MVIFFFFPSLFVGLPPLFPVGISAAQLVYETDLGLGSHLYCNGLTLGSKSMNLRFGTRVLSCLHIYIYILKRERVQCLGFLEGAWAAV